MEEVVVTPGVVKRGCCAPAISAYTGDSLITGASQNWIRLQICSQLTLKTTRALVVRLIPPPFTCAVSVKKNFCPPRNREWGCMLMVFMLRVR